MTEVQDLIKLASSKDKVYYYDADLYVHIFDAKFKYHGHGTVTAEITVAWPAFHTREGFEKRVVGLKDIRLLSTIERLLYF